MEKLPPGTAYCVAIKATCLFVILQFIFLFSRDMSYVQLLTRIKCVGTSRTRIKFRGSGKIKQCLQH